MDQSRENRFGRRALQFIGTAVVVLTISATFGDHDAFGQAQDDGENRNAASTQQSPLVVQAAGYVREGYHRYYSPYYYRPYPPIYRSPVYPHSWRYDQRRPWYGPYPWGFGYYGPRYYPGRFAPGYWPYAYYGYGYGPYFYRGGWPYGGWAYAWRGPIWPGAIGWPRRPAIEDENGDDPSVVQGELGQTGYYYW